MGILGQLSWSAPDSQSKPPLGPLARPKPEPPDARRGQKPPAMRFSFPEAKEVTVDIGQPGDIVSAALKALPLARSGYSAAVVLDIPVPIILTQSMLSVPGGKPPLPLSYIAVFEVQRAEEGKAERSTMRLIRYVKAGKNTMSLAYALPARRDEVLYLAVLSSDKPFVEGADPDELDKLLPELRHPRPGQEEKEGDPKKKPDDETRGKPPLKV